MEVQIGNLELKLCLTGWNCGAFLVLRDKTEISFASKRRIIRICPCRRHNPAAACHKASIRVVDCQVKALCLACVVRNVRAADTYIVHASLGK